MVALDPLLRYCEARQGTSIHLLAGSAPRMRVDGALEELQGFALTHRNETLDLLRELCSGDQWQTFLEAGSLDFVYGLRSGPQFRCSYFSHEQGVGAVFRLLPREPRTAHELDLPPAAKRLAEVERGLVLACGPSPGGSRILLWALADRINRNHARHVVTLERPVEQAVSSRRSVVSQREVGADCESFAAGLRSAARLDADVILLSELPDPESSLLALEAAAAGVLVLAPWVGLGAVASLERLIQSQPVERRSRALSALAEGLGAVVCRHAIPRADGRGEVDAWEFLWRTKELPELLRQGGDALEEALAGGRKAGMQPLDDVLVELVLARTISAVEGYKHARDKKRFEPLLRDADPRPAPAGSRR